MRSVALSTEQPCGIVGRLNPTRARRFAPFLDMTLRIESEPLLLVGLPSSIQASALAVRVCWEPQSTVELWIVQLYVADWELLAASVARTSNVWGLTARPEYDFGESQTANAAPSRRHSVVTAPPQLSLVLKANCAVVSAVVAAGFSVMEMLGAVRSATVQFRRTGSLGFSPSERSSARTSNVCGPRPRPVYWIPDWHTPKGAPSSEHSKTAGSFAEKTNVAVVASTVPDGPLSIVTIGTVRSATSHSYCAGRKLALPSLSACTSNVYSPSARFSYVCGDVQVCHVVPVVSPVSRHSKVLGDWSEVKANSAV